MGKLYLVLMFHVVLSFSLLAQTKNPQVIGSAGNSVSKASVQLTFTIGEIVTNTNKGKDTSVQLSQGFVHGNILANSISELGETSIVMYPNPASDIVFIEVPSYGNAQISYVLKDLLGKELKHENIIGRKAQISLQELPTAAYIIQVTYQEKVKIFKVVKN
jgi:hypothetical protein